MDVKHNVEFEVGFNSIVVLNLVSEGELFNARRLDEHFFDVGGELGCKVKVCHVQDWRALYRFFEEIRGSVECGEIPLLHVECHGDGVNGIKLNCGSYVCWEEWLSLLAPINVASGYRLLVFLAGCFGVMSIDKINLRKPAPFAFLVGSLFEVGAGEALESAKKFYEIIFRTRKMRDAIVAISEKFDVWSTERELLLAFVGIERNYGGKAARKDIEKITSDYVALGGDVQRARAYAKERVRNGKVLFDQVVNEHLGGSISWSYDDVKILAAERSVRKGR